MLRNRGVFILAALIVLSMCIGGCASVGDASVPEEKEPAEKPAEPEKSTGEEKNEEEGSEEKSIGKEKAEEQKEPDITESQAKDEEPVSFSTPIPKTPERVIRVPELVLPEALPPKPAEPAQPSVGDDEDSAEYIGKSVLGTVRVVKVLFKVAKKYSQFETTYRIYLRERYAALVEEKEEILAVNERLRSEAERAEARLKELEQRIALQKREPAPKDARQTGEARETEPEDSGLKAGSRSTAGDRDASAPSGRAGAAAVPEDGVEWKRKHVYAVPEDVIAISMGGTGWIYLGERDRRKGIAFKARKNSPRATEFVFRTEKMGEYHLQFQQQDLFTGEERWQEVRVSVVGEERFAEILSGKHSEEEDPEIMDASPKGYILADTYYKEGRKKEALAEYLKNYTDGDPRVNERIAHLSFEQEKYAQAEQYWRKNLYEDDIYKEKAVVGIIRTAVRREDVTVFEKMLPELLAIDTIPTDEPLLEGAEFQIDRGNTMSAANILESFIDRYYDHEKADWAYFTLGNLHEKSGPLRDFRKAKYYYRVVLNDFPASSYWDKSEERIRYIDMYLLKVQ